MVGLRRRKLGDMLGVLVEFFSKMKLCVREENLVLDPISYSWIGFFEVS